MTEIPVTIVDPNGEKIFDTTVPVTPGTFSGQFTAVTPLILPDTSDDPI
jgi:hypothetical protein